MLQEASVDNEKYDDPCLIPVAMTLQFFHAAKDVDALRTYDAFCAVCMSYNIGSETQGFS